MWWLLVPLVVGALQHTRDPDSLRLTVTPSFAMNPGAFRAVVMIESNPDNRWLVLRADSPEYYRSSTTQLDGATAPRRHMMIFEGLPAGRYVIEAVLERNNGHRLKRDITVQVKGMPGRR